MPQEKFGLSKDEYRDLVKQCQDEIMNSETFMRPKWEKWRKRLKLLNNQKKNEADISEPLAHIHFNTIHAALYDDEISTTFLPREQGDCVVTEALNPLYEYDSEIMKKRILDYQWIWNTLFFSRSLVYMFEFDRKNKVPQPEVVNMLTFYRDPNATSVNGDSRGRGAMRFGGRPILMTKKDLEDAEIYENIDDIMIGTKDNDIIQQAKDSIRDAQGFESDMSDDVIGENRLMVIMEWLTIFNGKRVVVGLANGNNLVVRYTVLKDQEEWGIVEQTLYPNSLSWDGTSVMDLIEDKQRAKAKIINAALFSVEANGNHMYAYDVTKIQNESDLDFELNKHVPVDGNPSNVIAPIQRSQIGNEIQWMLDYVDNSAQKATGATEIQQGAATGAKKTATEIATISESVDTRFNLLSKVIGWSEQAFARYWYKMYKLHFKSTIDKKIMRIVGENGIFFKTFTRENLIGNVDPDVMVKSKVVGEARRIREIQEFNSEFEVLAKSPNINIDELIRKRAKLGGASEMDMQRMFKPDPDRVLAIGENERLNKNKFVEINPTDDDLKHMDEHNKSADTKALQVHVQAHMKAYLAKNKNPKIKEEAAALQQPNNPQAPQTPEDMGLKNQNLNAVKTLNTA